MEAYYVLGVLAFMAALIFCKNLLECLHAFATVVSSCAGCVGNCKLNYDEKQSAREVLMVLLVLCGVGKQCILILGANAGRVLAQRSAAMDGSFRAIGLEHVGRRTPEIAGRVSEPLASRHMEARGVVSPERVGGGSSRVSDALPHI